MIIKSYWRMVLIWALGVSLWAQSPTRIDPSDGNSTKADTAPSTLKLTKEERDFLKAHPVLIAHNESNWPPFNFNENGVARGFSVDYMKLLAKRLGVEVDFISGYTWEEFMKMLPTGSLDLIINMAPTEERAKSFAFTHPYISVRNAIYTNLNNQFYYSLDDLKGKRVALPKGFFIQRFLAKNYPQIKQVLVRDQLEALQLLSFGKVDAIIGKQVVVDYLLRKYLLSNIVATNYVNDPRTLSHIAIAVSRKDAILARILDKAQATISPKELEQLRHHWFGINALLDTKAIFSDKERAYLRHKKTVNVCIETDRAPIEFVEKGIPKGVAIDTVQIIAKRLGLKTRFVTTDSWEQTEELMRQRKCDLMPAALQTRRNRSILLFSRSYFSYETIIVTRKELGSVKGLRELEGKVLAARWDTPLTERMEESHPDIRTLEFATYAEAFEAVEKGDADFALTTPPVFNYYKLHMNLKKLHIAGTAPISCDLSIAVRKDELLLFSSIGKILELLPRETFRAINDKWTKSSVVEKMDYALLARYLAAAFLIVLFILVAYIRQRKLSRKIEELNSTLEKKIEEALEKNREQQLLMLHRNRLANMGEMIAMIAHQWRQPLNNLSLLNQLLVAKFNKGQLNEETINYFSENSRKQIQQMSRTIDDFRNFYKPEREKREFCVEEAVHQLIDMVGITFKSEKVEIIYQAEGCHYYYGYPNEMAHALLNIMNNARDALKEKGFGSKKIRIDVRKEGTDILIEICDNAGGIPEEILPRIFDPYFSTKNEKNGTGLGLYMTNVIITDHMGSKIEARNSEEGACFLITLKENNAYAS